VLRGLIGTKRESLILEGFLRYHPQHEFHENRMRISLKSLAIPADVQEASVFNALVCPIRLKEHLRFKGQFPELSNRSGWKRAVRGAYAQDEQLHSRRCRRGSCHHRSDNGGCFSI
jgi:hypothetical protein